MVSTPWIPETIDATPVKPKRAKLNRTPAQTATPTPQKKPSQPAKRVRGTDAPLKERIESRSRNGQDYLETLHDLAINGESDRSKIEASKLLLSYGWGKPITPIVAQIELDVTERILVDVPNSELEALLADAPQVDIMRPPSQTVVTRPE